MNNFNFDPPLDSDISNEVIILKKAGIHTYESCEGGNTHSYPEPTVRFYGDNSEGFKALAIAIQNGLKVKSLRRIWTIINNEPVGPDWELTFWNLKGE